MLPGLRAVRGSDAIDALRDERLLTDPVEVRHREVQDKTGGQTKRNHRQEERHDLHDHLLLAIDLSTGIPTLDLSLLNETGCCNDDDQHKEWQCMADSLLHRLARTFRQIEPKGLHLIGGGEVLVHLRRGVDPCWIEHTFVRGCFCGGLAETNLTRDPAHAGTKIADPPREATEHLIQHEEHRHLHQQRKTATQGIDAVFLVELEQFLVEFLAIVLEPGLNLLHFRLELLHHHHRTRALEGQGRHDHHDHQRQQDDGNGIVPGDVVEERQH